MSKLRKLYSVLISAAHAHARWDYEVSTSILRSRKRIIVLIILSIPAILFSIAYAADSAVLPEFLGGKTAYSPAFYTPKIFLVSILVGLCAGLVTGCIGAGGGFIITPALMSVGIKGILAVGTDLFHIFAKAIIGTAVHKKLGNVSVWLAVAFLVGSLVGVTFGGGINRALYDYNPVLSDTFISLIYVVLLGFLGIYSLIDFLRLRKGVDAEQAGEEELEELGWSAKLQSVHIPPMITFDEDLLPGGKRVSAWFVAFCGAIVGFMAAIMGVGGGFLTFPMFVYILGVSSFTTVGTDILQIIFTAGYASISQYAIYGFIFYTLAMGMLLGSLLGIQIGALTTKLVKGIYIRGFYATAILAGFVNRLFALPCKLSELEIIELSDSTISVLYTLGNWSFFIVMSIFSLWVIGTFFSKISLLREEE